MKLSSCFHCENNMESSIVQLENENNSNINNSIINLHNHKLHHHQQQQVNMIGYTSIRCLGSILSIRTARSFKSLCFLTAILTFCIGISIGILIPLYLMPNTESLLVGRSISSSSNHNSSISSSSNDGVIYDNKIVNNVHDYNSASIILRRRAEEVASVMNQATNTITTTTPNSIFLNDESTNADEDISSRFPEFAQIQALVQRTSTSNTQINNHHHHNHNHRTKVMSNSNNNNNIPILLRPNPNVQFVTSDSRILSLHPIQQQFNSSTIEINKQQMIKLNSNEGVPNVVNSDSDLIEGIYWSDKVERQLPKGFTNQNITDWKRLVEQSTIEQIEEGCGRMQNRLLTFENHVHACCRYRQNSDQIQGEIFSFYLSRLLGLENLPPSTLALIQLSDPKWMKVKSELNAAQWIEEKPVVFTQFIKNLSPAYIPLQLRDSKRSLHPIDIILSSNSIDSTSSLSSSTTSSLDVKELAQWSDLIVFDYLTANLDRMVNNLYNLQWNPSMMEAPAHNLVKDTSTGLLVFLDNESGLLHGYRLLDKYEQYHRLMLDSLCIFRKSTVNAIKKLHRDKNIGLLLKDMFHSSEPLLVDYLPTMPDKSIKILNHRIERVYDQISKCETLYPL